jgi:tetratricopeptide (TPR) repeat protein
VARQRIPDSAEVYEYLAEVRLHQGNRAEAARLARQALAMDPSVFGGDIEVLGSADIRRGDYASARSRFARAFPYLLEPGSPVILIYDVSYALAFAYILRMTGETERANLLIDLAEQAIRNIPRLGEVGYGVADVQILALRGKKAEALVALRAAEKSGWRNDWRFYRDFEPSLTSIRNEPEFKAVFADIERDMARQRAELGARH